MATISLKLLVDKKRNRVVFAESDKDFINVLFSFLTLPMGTIIRLLDKQSSVGCMDKLYESLENLDAKYFETEACKTMLLQPRSAAERLCEDLLINADDLAPRRLYRCPEFDCSTKNYCYYSSICGACCPCGRRMDKVFEWDRQKAYVKNDVFLKGAEKFIISDDLHVAPASIANTLSLLQKLGIEDVDILENRIIDVHRDEVLYLLGRLLLSKMPLTDVFLRRSEYTIIVEGGYELAETAQIKLEIDDAATQAKTIRVKLLKHKITNKVVYVEAVEDFVDILFSFLTFPLGYIVELLQGHSSIGCVDNLYESVNVLGIDNNCIRSKECMDMLRAPMLYPHFDCDSQLLRVKEENSLICEVLSCETCWGKRRDTCKHNTPEVNLTEINPKLPNWGTGYGGGYAKKSVRFMLTSDMAVTPHSPISGMNIIRELKSPISSLIEKEVTLGEAEVLSLLRACLVSRTALDSVLQPKKLERTFIV